MGEVKPLRGADAIAEIRKIADNQPTMFCTFAYNQSLHVRPMGTLKIDDDGTFWFFSPKGSGKNQAIENNNLVHLIYSQTSKSEYLFIKGHASISRDQAKIDELWNPICKNWFPDGKDDPNITVIRVTLSKGHYWDTKHNKMIQLAGMAVGAITGKPLDSGIEGSIKA